MSDPDTVGMSLETNQRLSSTDGQDPVDRREIRRKHILASLELNGSDIVPQLWEKLTEEEKLNNEIMYKILSTGTDLFGACPWCPSRDDDQVELPRKFVLDADAVLAFLQSVNRLDAYFALWLPESLRDNKQVMMALCDKNCCRLGPELQYASPRLRDDEDVVRKSIFSDLKNYTWHSLKFASDRLRKDRKLIQDLLDAASTASEFAFRISQVLEHVKWDHAEEAKHVAVMYLGRAMKETYTRRPTRHEWWSKGVQDFLQRLPASLRDDRELMLQFIEVDWRSFNNCSEDLRRDDAVVKKALLQKYALCPVHHEIMEEMLKEMKSGALFDRIPEAVNTDKAVLLALIEAGKMSFDEYMNLPESTQLDKEIIIAFAKGRCFYEENVSHFVDEVYRRLPARMQQDEEIALALLNAQYPYPDHFFARIPSLYNHREAMMALTKLPYGITELVSRCGFRDDEEFMLKVYEVCPETMEHATERLRSDREFMERASELGWRYFISYATPEFQVDNVDLVAKAFKNSWKGTIDSDDNFFIVDHAVWRQRPAVLACLNEGATRMLHRLASFDPEDPLLSDRELILLSAANRPEELQYAPASVRHDREFILSLVQQNGRVLKYAAKELQRDEEILVAAMFQNGGTVVDCFDILNSEVDFEFIREFAARVRSKIEAHHTFIDSFLFGMMLPDLSNKPPAKPCKPPAKRCILPMLDQGLETSTEFKKSIAKYVGAPMGQEFLSLRAASVNLAKLGF